MKFSFSECFKVMRLVSLLSATTAVCCGASKPGHRKCKRRMKKLSLGAHCVCACACLGVYCVYGHTLCVWVYTVYMGIHCVYGCILCIWAYTVCMLA